MAEVRLHGDKMEAIAFSVREGEFYMSLDFPESSLKKGRVKDNVQYYQTREFKISLEQQVFLIKFLEYANIAHQIQIKPKIQVNLEQIINSTPPEALKQIAHKIEKRLEQLNQDKDET